MAFGSDGSIFLGIEHNIASNRSSHVWGGKIDPFENGYMNSNHDMNMIFGMGEGGKIHPLSTMLPQLQPKRFRLGGHQIYLQKHNVHDKNE